MKRSKHMGWVSRFIIFFFVLVVCAWGGWLWWRDGVSPVDPRDTEPVTFVVASGDGVKAIAANLSEERLIRSSTGFYVLVKLLGIEKELQAGEFRLNRSMDAYTIATELTHGLSDIWVTIPEGWRVEEIAAQLGKEFDIPEQEFLKYAEEGYMFPDTYLIPRDATAAAIAEIFRKNFDTKVTGKMRSDASRTGLTLKQVIVLASIVEREGLTDQDRPVIAGILLKRLKADWPLQTDATLQYMLGYQAAEKSWWKKSLYDEDKKISSPFNTYMNTGLPSRPIANPGLSSITAVIYPTNSEYWYYIHDPTGTAHYAKTIEEHEANVEKYLR